MKKFFIRLRLLIKPKPKIEQLSELKEFVRIRSSKISGEAIIKYAQKRLGKLHYNLAKTNLDYSNDLVNCQAKLNAEVLADIYFMLCKVLHNNQHSTTLQKMITDVYSDYTNSAADDYQVTAYLTEDHFQREHNNLSSMAAHTGKKLFHLLPVRKDLLPGNVQIFQGQIRFAYIAFLEDFGKRGNITTLQNQLHELDSTQVEKTELS